MIPKILLELFVPMARPIAKARPRLGRNGAVFTPRETADAEKAIAMLAKRELPAPAPAHVPLSVDVTVLLDRPKTSKNAMPTVRPDADNFLKLALDALNGVAWADDCQVVDATVRKRYALSEPLFGKNIGPGYLIVVRAADGADLSGGKNG
jgi:Holliday junction resolvase RusA-like endonuclease